MRLCTLVTVNTGDECEVSINSVPGHGDTNNVGDLALVTLVILSYHSVVSHHLVTGDIFTDVQLVTQLLSTDAGSLIYTHNLCSGPVVVEKIYKIRRILR